MAKRLSRIEKIYELLKGVDAVSGASNLQKIEELLKGCVLVEVPADEKRNGCSFDCPLRAEGKEQCVLKLSITKRFREIKYIKPGPKCPQFYGE